MRIAHRVLALALTAGLIAGLGWATWHYRARAAQAEQALETAQEAAKRTQATLTFREGLRARHEAVRALQRVRLDAVLAAEHDWGDTPVPTDVQTELCSVLHCAQRVLGGASDPNP